MSAFEDELSKQIVAACRVFHNPENSARQKEAEKFLKQTQNRVEAWQVSDRLLRDTSLPLEVLFYAAQTIKIKVRSQINSLETIGKYENFRDSLVQHILRYSYLPDKHTVLVQVSVALASFAVQFYEKWQDSVEYFFKELSEKHSQALLLILEMIPEECQTDDHVNVITGNKFIGLVKHFGKYVPQILSLLRHYLHNSGQNRALQKKIFACFDRWLVFCDPVVPPPSLIESPLISQSFRALQVPELFHTCVEAIISLITRCERKEYLVIVNKIFTHVLELEPTFDKAFEESDYEVARGLCKIFVQTGDSFCDNLWEASDESLRLVRVIIKVMAFPDHEVAAIGFSFWAFFLGDLRQILRSANLQDPRVAERNRRWTEIFMDLIKTLNTAMRLPNNYETLDEQQQDELGRFRWDCADTIREAAVCLSEEIVLKLIFEGIASGYRQYEANKDDIQALESWLFCLWALHQFIPQEDDKILPQIFHMLKNFPPNPEIRQTVTELLGRFAPWIRKHPDQYLRLAFEYITPGLNSKRLQPVTCESFKNICDHCSDTILQQNLLPGLWDIYQRSHVLGNVEQLNIIEGLVFVYSALPPEQMVKHLNEMALHATNDMRKNWSLNEVTIALDRLSHIAKSFYYTVVNFPKDLPHPIVQLYVQMSKYYDHVISVFSQNDSLMEKVVKAIRYSCKCRPAEFSQYVVPILQKIEVVHKNHPHPCFLYLASVFVGEYANFPEFHEIITKVLDVFVKPTSACLRDRDSFDSHPDLAEDFFRLTGRYITTCPSILFESEYFKEVFQCGILGLTLRQYDALSVIVAFFQDFIAKADPKNKNMFDAKHVEFVYKVIDHYGTELGAAICWGIWDLPHVGVMRVERLLENMYEFSGDRQEDKGKCFAKWLMEGLKRMDYYKDDEAKQNFYQAYLHARDSRDRLDTVRNLERACDAYRKRNQMS